MCSQICYISVCLFLLQFVLNVSLSSFCRVDISSYLWSQIKKKRSQIDVIFHRFSLDFLILSSIRQYVIGLKIYFVHIPSMAGLSSNVMARYLLAQRNF